MWPAIITKVHVFSYPLLNTTEYIKNSIYSLYKHKYFQYLKYINGRRIAASADNFSTRILYGLGGRELTSLNSRVAI